MPDVARTLPRLDAHHDLLRADGPERVDHDLALDGLDRVDDDGDCSRIELLKGLVGAGWVSVSLRGMGNTSGGGRTYLLGVDIDAREPASEARVRVIPSDDHLWSALQLDRVSKGRGARNETMKGGGAAHRPVCLSMSSIFVWKTGSTASTETPVPLCGMAKTSMGRRERLSAKTEPTEAKDRGRRTDNPDGVLVDEIAEHKTHDFEWHACPSMLEHLCVEYGEEPVSQLDRIGGPFPRLRARPAGVP